MLSGVFLANTTQIQIFVGLLILRKCTVVEGRNIARLPKTLGVIECIEIVNMTGNMLRCKTAGSAMQCVSLCVADKSCTCVNYHRTEKHCELLSNSSETSSALEDWDSYTIDPYAR